MPSRSVLVVDDDPVIAATVAEVLRLSGFSTVTATNGLAALEHLERNHPNVILLDLDMPVLDGWGFARTIAESRKDLKLVVMTGSPHPQRDAEQLGADGYLAKPFDFEHLLNEVTRLSAT
jgi:two-component system chemotaxis response regulator CheY